MTVTSGPVVTHDVQTASEIILSPATPSSAYLLKQAEQWTWQDVRDYVIASITERFGAPKRDLLKETGIFKGFHGRHGALNAVIVAQMAFEIHRGIWRNAPISVTRFTQGNDPYFADVLIKQLKG